MSKRQKTHHISSGLTPSHLAKLNKLIYEDKSQWGGKLDNLGLKGWSVHDKSTDNTMVLVNHDLKHTLTVHSGTNLKKRAGQDLTTDAFIVGDLLSITPRYQQALNTQKEIMKDYKGYKHSTTGFSLGGAVANQIGHDLNVESHAFNPGVSPKVFPRQLSPKGVIAKAIRWVRGKKSDEADQHLYLTQGDWISNSGLLGIHGDEYVHFNKTKPGASSAAGAAHDIENWVQDE